MTKLFLAVLIILTASMFSYKKINEIVFKGTSVSQDVRTGDSVVLSVSSFNKNDSKQTTYDVKWLKKPTDSKAVITLDKNGQASFTTDSDGTYEIAVLTKLDGKIISVDNKNTISINASSENLPPVANAGKHQEVILSKVVILDGTLSFDPNKDQLSYKWFIIKQPDNNVPNIKNQKSVKAALIPSVEGEYVIGLVVNDGKLQSEVSTVTINVCTTKCEQTNQKPVAHAGEKQIVSLDQIVNLNGSESYDPDGNELKYLWYIISKPLTSKSTLSNFDSVISCFKPDVAGEYTLGLVVNDNKFDSDPATVVVKVTLDNLPPIAQAGTDITVKRGGIVVLDGTKSFDKDNDPLTYNWTIVSSPMNNDLMLDDPFSDITRFEARSIGSYVFDLEVSDGKSVSRPSRVVITVTDNNTIEKPIADAGNDISILIPNFAKLDGSKSKSIDNLDENSSEQLIFRWSIIDTPSESKIQLQGANTVSPSFRPDLLGVYKIQLIVSDGDVQSDPDEVMVKVMGHIPPNPNTPPIAKAGKNQIAYLTSMVELNGSNSGDPLGRRLTYKWSLIKSPQGSKAILTDYVSAKTSFIPDVPGIYTYELTVNNGVSSKSDQISIRVKEDIGTFEWMPEPASGAENNFKNRLLIEDKLTGEKFKIDLSITEKSFHLTNELKYKTPYTVSRLKCTKDVTKLEAKVCPLEDKKTVAANCCTQPFTISITLINKETDEVF